MTLSGADIYTLIFCRYSNTFFLELSQGRKSHIFLQCYARAQIFSSVAICELPFLPFPCMQGYYNSVPSKPDIDLMFGSVPSGMIEAKPCPSEIFAILYCIVVYSYSLVITIYIFVCQAVKRR